MKYLNLIFALILASPVFAQAAVFNCKSESGNFMTVSKTTPVKPFQLQDENGDVFTCRSKNAKAKRSSVGIPDFEPIGEAAPLHLSD